MSSPCCTPKKQQISVHPHIAAIDAIVPAQTEVTAQLKSKLIQVPGGFFDMGASKSRFPQDNDSPRRKIKVADFLMSPHAVSNTDFAQFANASGYKTVAEREEWSFVFHRFLKHPERYGAPQGLPWWRQVEGASWRCPEGPDSSIVGKENHPVVHISWYDAVAYCKWSGVRLPSEKEWERAARGGLQRKKFPWGNSLTPAGQHAMNIWQGSFPDINTAEDGYTGTAPVNAYAPNAFGLFNMTGNVWEWVETTFEPISSANIPLLPTQRGGSYLCHASYCDRYQTHSRTGAEPDSSAGHSGFRVAADLRN